LKILLGLALLWGLKLFRGLSGCLTSLHVIVLVYYWPIVLRIDIIVGLDVIVLLNVIVGLNFIVGLAVFPGLNVIVLFGVIVRFGFVPLLRVVLGFIRLFNFFPFYCLGILLAYCFTD
jgi:hypothetical protein